MNNPGNKTRKQSASQTGIIWPIAFFYSSSSYYGGTVEIKTEGNKLYHRFSLYNWIEGLPWTVLEPTRPEAWNSLYGMARQMAKWKRSYVDRSIYDGTEWELKLEYPDTKVHTKGYCKWPEGFHDFLEVLQQLAGNGWPDGFFEEVDKGNSPPGEGFSF